MLNKNNISRQLLWFLVLIQIFIPGVIRSAQSSVCARVKIEIRQELTLERQAFDAEMIINNGLTNVALKDISVNVHFMDDKGAEILATSDPNNTSATFFYKVQQERMKNISNVTGTGQVEPSTSAEIHWLIIPALGAAKAQQQGTLYYVGATLRYTLAGKEQVVNVTPDHIFVKPMPELTLEYFLPNDVYADDPDTQEQEPSEPFTLGVLVRNNGEGTAKSLKIQSAQPKIIDNDLGLLINFIINGCEVNGQPSKLSLLADFGDIKPKSAGIVRWQMSTTLSGKFVDFRADYTHSDELGGVLTSLITGVYKNFLIHDVLVDLPGRDNIRDFLAWKASGGNCWVFESDNIDFAVRDVSEDTTLTCNNLNCSVSSVETAGFVYAKEELQGQLTGQESIKGVIRSDGKVLKPDNFWISKTRYKLELWKYYFNLFDVNTTGSYKVELQNFVPPSLAIQPINDKTVVEGSALNFPVVASGASNIALKASSLPVSATFSDQGNGTGSFGWTPSEGQAGRYFVTFTAAAGTYSTSKNVQITVHSSKDTDGDGLPDWWEMQYFGNLTRDGKGSYAGDGISDLEKYSQGLDPTKPNLAPSVPEILSPADGSEVTSLRPLLEIRPSTDANNDEISYVYEVYTEREIRNLGFSAWIPSTSWAVPEDLRDHAWYFWRVRATDGKGYSRWAYGKFLVNISNEPPGVSRLSGPVQGAEVDTLTPLFEILNGHDEDADGLTYIFEVYANDTLGTLLYSSGNILQAEGSSTSWRLNWDLKNQNQYWWRVKTVDEHGAVVDSNAGSFKVNLSTASPVKPEVIYPPVGEIQAREVNLIASATVSGIEGYYIFEIDTSITFDSPYLLTSAPLNAIDETVSWHLTGLEDNTRYFWRVCASNGTAFSRWTYSTFFVNIANETPETPTIGNPGNEAWETTLTPTLEVNPTSDVDRDTLRYQFEVYDDEWLTSPVQSIDTDIPEWTLPSALRDKTWYYWRARAIDEHGAASPWTYGSKFFARDDGIDDKPEITIVAPTRPVVTNGNDLLLRWIDKDSDSNADIALYYDTDLSGNDGVLITQGIKENPDGPADSYIWNLTNIPEGTYYAYAIITDGANSVVRYCPNAITIDRQGPSVTIAPQPGTFDEPLEVTITPNEDADIYYTTDGSNPNAESMVYSHPIAIQKTTTLRMKAIDRAGNEGSVITAKYTVHEPLNVTVRTSGGALLRNISVSGFKESGVYSENQAITNEEGVASFGVEDFEPGNYRFQAEYLGSKFWSNLVQIPGTLSVELIIPDELVRISIPTTYGLAKGAYVYIYDENGAYLGISAVANDSGQVEFRLPAGMRFMFSAVINEKPVFTDIKTVSSGGINNIIIDTVTSSIKITLKGGDVPLTGMDVHLFSSGGEYLSMSTKTDAFGEATFRVSPGIYRLRADYLSCMFWNSNINVRDDTPVDFVIPHRQVQVNVTGMFQGVPEPVEGMTVEIFAPSGVSTGLTQRADANGRAVFTLPETELRANASYLGHEFWSEPFNGAEALIVVPLAEAEIRLTGEGIASEKINVYVYSASGETQGNWDEILGSEKALFRIPAGAYKFKADFRGKEYWSTEEMLVADISSPFTLAVGADLFILTVLKAKGVPIKSVNAYVYNEDGSYTDKSATTNLEGKAYYDINQGRYRFRVDHLGYQFWTEPHDVMASMFYTFTIQHKTVRVTVSRQYLTVTPYPSVRVYLYTEEGVYVNVSKLTSDLGQAAFSVPNMTYKARVDYVGRQFWSPPFKFANSSVTIPVGEIEARVLYSNNYAVSGAVTYLYNEVPKYLKWTQNTDSAGYVRYLVPAGSYRVRADFSSTRRWSPVFNVTAGQKTPVTIKLLISYTPPPLEKKSEAAVD